MKGYCSILFLVLLMALGEIHALKAAPSQSGLPDFPERGLPDDEVVLAGEQARLVELTMEAVYLNQGAADVERVRHQVTIPATADYQIPMAISLRGVTDAQVRMQRNGIDRYLDLAVSVPRARKTVIAVTFHLLLIPLDYSAGLAGSNGVVCDESACKWLAPSKFVESDAPEIITLSRSLAVNGAPVLDIARLAYELPARYLRFKPQPRALGALAAYRARTGDCTEYAALFAALCRASRIPARLYSGFNVGESLERTYAMPNHTMAEVCLHGVGWMPVDPNMGKGAYTNNYRFGRTPGTVIYLQREGSWVWGSSMSRADMMARRVSVSVQWKTHVRAAGNARELYQSYR